jgi:hypothetical protein
METAQLARFHWSPPPDGQIVEFAAQTECSYLELIYNPASSFVTRLEGTLDDASLSSWFEKVPLTPTCNIIDRTFNLLRMRKIVLR